MRMRATGGSACVLILTLLMSIGDAVFAQDAVLEALHERRLQARVIEILEDLEVRHARQVDIPPEWPRQGVLGPLPPIPRHALDTWEYFRDPEPVPVVFDTLHFATNMEWRRIGVGEEERFILRFGEALWTGTNAYVQSPLDTIATPEIRARLHSLYGAPTRMPVARSRPAMNSGSAYVQFEYWFVVNDSIPVVIMDRDGPFGRGVVIVADEEHVGLFQIIVDDLAQRLSRVTRLMPYVDYYQSRERNAWFRTGYDGEAYYILETERPRWARRGQSRAQWYDFR